jgi:hypothetical protein
MNPEDYERYRRQLEGQLRADVEILYAAYCAKLRAYEMMHQLPAEVLSGLLPAAGLPLSLPPAAAPPPPARPRRGPNELYLAVLQSLEKLPEVFDRSDIQAALGDVPHRASLYRVLQDLEQAGWLKLEERGEGRLSNLYRKLATPEPGSPPDPD